MRDGCVSIAIGLFGLGASAYVPAMPVVSAMALVAAGATAALSLRLADSPLKASAMAVHLFVYVSLYLIFVGAVFHATVVQSQHGIHALLIVDLGISAGLMAHTVRNAVLALTGAVSQ